MKIRHLCLAASLAAATSVAQAQFYIFKDLGTYASYNYFDVAGINNNGEVVGTAYEAVGRPVAYRHAGGSFYIAPSPGPAHSAWGYAINAGGTIAGMCDRNGSTLHTFHRAPGGPSVDIDSDWGRDSSIVAINDSGYVAGQADSEPFLGHTSGWMWLMGATLGADFNVTDVNNGLVMVGNGPWGGMIYNVGTGVKTYLGYALGTWSNTASVINESGVVAGTKGGEGFIYDAGSVTLFGANVAAVTGINKNGDVVGVTTGERAFVYLRATHQFLDLNTLVASTISSKWTFIDAGGINDDGVIAVQARRLATEEDGEGYGMYVYRAAKLSPFRFRPLPIFTLGER
jgi:probable HAF family extracellular repeat protein